MSVIKIGVITSVDATNYMVSVDLFDGSSAIDIQCSSSYFSSKNGGGIICIPEVDSLCMLEHVNGEYIVVGFIAENDLRYKVDGTPDHNIETPGFRCGRPGTWDPGDVGIVGASRNSSYIKVGATGIISLFSSPLCNAHFMPSPKNAVEITTDNVSWKMGESLFSLKTNRDTGGSIMTIDVQNADKTQGSKVTVSAGKNDSTIKIEVTSGVSMEYTKEGGLTASFEGPVNITSKKNISLNDGNLVIKN